MFTDLYHQALKKYIHDKEAAKKLTAFKETSPELAAMTVVANAMLNLDEAVMRE